MPPLFFFLVTIITALSEKKLGWRKFVSLSFFSLLLLFQIVEEKKKREKKINKYYTNRVSKRKKYNKIIETNIKVEKKKKSNRMTMPWVTVFVMLS